MPLIYNLDEYSDRLKGASLIVGDGLCSNIYVLGRENAVIVDTGVGNYANPVWPQLEVFIHTLDTRYIASHLGSSLVKVEDGDVIETELWPLRAIWTPGHTEGGMCLYNEDERILISGDTVFPDGYYGRYDGDSGSLEAIIESLGKLVELEVDIMLPGHGSPVFDGANDHIEKAYRNASRHA